MRRLQALFALLVATVFAPVPAQAQCVIMPLAYYVSSNDIAAIFRGTARDVKTVPAGQIVTFEVDRVWKGRVSETTVIHNLNIGWSEEDTFALGERYLVMAHRQSAEERARFGNDAREALGTHICGSYSPDGEMLAKARGYAPRPDPK